MDRRLPRLQKAAKELRVQVPHAGWVKTIRNALGISDRAFAKRLGITHGSLQELERNEQRGTVSLESLRRAADALDADFVYAIVPRKKLRETISARAREVAREQVLPVAKSMALEQQGISQAQIKRQVDELARELENRPRELWR
jgi:predicted DNA-binding mobile mystery protein A